MIARILALVLGLFSGLVASQAPEFAQQYRQRIGGAIDELRTVVGRFDEGAQAEGTDRAGALARLREQPDPIAQRQAAANEEVADRLARLERQRDEAAAAGPYGRIVALAKGFDPTLARATYLDYEPAWPATGEGLTIGGAAFLVGWVVFRLLFRSLGRLAPRRWRRQPRDDLRTA